MKALLSALNVAFFQRETRGIVRLNLVAMCFTIGGLAMIALMLAVIAVVPMLLRLLPIGWGAETILAVIRWPLMLGLLIAALAAVYRWGPRRLSRAGAGSLQARSLPGWRLSRPRCCFPGTR